MKRKKLYIGISILIFILIVGLIGWALFIGKQHQDLQQGTQDLGYLDGSTNQPSRGGLFGRVFDDVTDTTTIDEEEKGPKPTLRQLYNLPTAGFIKKRSSAIRFVDRATGHVFEKELPNGTATRVDQTTVPKVSSATFLEDGDVVIRQYTSDDDSLISVLSDLKSEEVQSIQLPTELLSLVASPSGKEFARIENTFNGSRVVVSNVEDEVEREVLNSSLRGWNLQWENDLLLLTQKASHNLPGSSYIIDVDSSIKKLAIQQLSGLITNLSPDGSQILYTNTSNEGLPLLAVQNLDTGISTDLNISGLADKCVWHPYKPSVYCALPNEFAKGVYPDDWYQSKVIFADSVWEINTKTAVVRHIISPENSEGISLDIIKLVMDKNGSIIFFVNKTDQTLWSLQLTDTHKSATE